MDFVHDVLPLLGSIVAVIVILYLTYVVSKYVSKNVTATSSGGTIRIVERIALAQDKLLVIAEIDGTYSLIGVSNNGINILKDLPDYTPPVNTQGVPNFLDTLKKVGKNK